MRQEKEFNIQFTGLKIGSHDFEYHIDKDFFDLFDYEDYNSVDVEVKATLIKKETFMELSLSHDGTVNVPCDVSGDDFDLTIEGEIKLLVKFGDQYNNENEELLILPHGEFQFNIAQFIYEMIVLSVPQKRVHPDIADEYEADAFDEDELDFLLDLDDEDDDFDDEDIEDDEIEEQQEDHKETDPRWDELKKLLTDK
jgi:uncharacterized metal-binding protein YceD (DUF177 family)